MASTLSATRKCVIAAKEETVYGTDSTPDGTSAILTTVPDFSVNAEETKRDYAKASFSPSGFVPNQFTQQISFSTELKGANDNTDPDKAPRFADLLEACGMTQTEAVWVPLTGITGGPFVAGETVTGGTSAKEATVRRVKTDGLIVTGATGDFDTEETLTGGTSGATGTTAASNANNPRLEFMPMSDINNQKSATIGYYKDGIFHKLTGCRGSVKLAFAIGGYPKLDFNFTGIYNAPTDAANITVASYEEHLPPLFQGIGLAIGTYSPTGIEKFDLDLANQVNPAKDAQNATGVSAIRITDRTPTASFDFDVDELANFNPWTLFQNGTTQNIEFMCGTAVGNRIYVEIPAAQLKTPAYQDKNGVAAYNMSLEPTGNDDEIIIAFG